MNQARRQTRRQDTTQHRVISAGLREIVFIFFCFASLYLFVSLATYDPLDPGFSHSPAAHTTVDQILNQGGLAGALFSDIFFKWFGYFAYLFAYMVGYFGWLIYQGRHHDLLNEPKHLILPTVGFVLTLTAGCGLAIVHFAAESTLLPSHAGGDLGTWIGHGLQNMLSALGATLLLLVLFFTGVTLLTGLSWLKLMDRLGETTLYYTPIFARYVRYTLSPWLIRKSRQLWQWSLLKVQQLKHFYQVQQQNKRNRQAAQEAAVELPEQVKLALEDAPPTKAKPASEPPTPWIAEKKPLEATAEATTSASVETHNGLPALSLLAAPVEAQDFDFQQAAKSLQAQIETELQTLGETDARIIALHPGPVVIRVEIHPGKEQLSYVVRLADNLLERLAIKGARATESNAELLILEVPNAHRQPIALRELLQTQAYSDSRSPLTLALGKDLNGYPVIIDLARMPHLLLSGQQLEEINRALHVFLLSLLYKATPQQLRLILLDSRSKCLSLYRELWHLLTPVVTHPEAVLDSFAWCVGEMERRYRLMASLGVRNMDGYNKRIEELQAQHNANDATPVAEKLPYVLVVMHEIAELSTLEQGRDIEELITRLAQKSRAAGIHMMLASSQPTVNVITGLMKTNFPTRIAFQVQSKTESRHILGQSGAEYLLGKGDMLYLTPGTGIPTRVHGAQVEAQEVNKVVQQLREYGKPKYVDLSSDS